MKTKREGFAQVRLNDELRAALREAAEREDRSQAAIIRRAIRQYLGIQLEK
jgi:predicted transcriptional regulator